MPATVGAPYWEVTAISEDLLSQFEEPHEFSNHLPTRLLCTSIESTDKDVSFSWHSVTLVAQLADAITGDSYLVVTNEGRFGSLIHSRLIRTDVSVIRCQKRAFRKCPGFW